jgi:hypothetical protein
MPAALGPVTRRRVSLPRVLLGVLLILGFALAGAVLGSKLDTRLPVLATAHALSAGQTITDGDLTVVRVAVGSGVTTTPASARASVVGRTAAVPLAAGSLVTPAQVGTLAWPPAGQSVIALAVKAGHAPAGLSAGTHVTVLVVPTAGGTTGTASTATQVVSADATVVSIREAADQSGSSIVSLLLVAADATRVASTPGDASLVQLGAGR